MPNPAPEAPQAVLSGLAPVSERRGAVVAGALVCTTLLVVGYGSGIGVAPLGPLAASGAPGTDGAGGETATEPPGSGPDEAAFITTNPPGGGGGTGIVSTSIPGGGDGVGIMTPGGGVLPGITIPNLPPGGTVTPPTSTPPGTSPSTSPPTTNPPGTTPPPDCAALVSDLLTGLVGYLAGPSPDAALVQHVSDALGLEGYLLGGSGDLLGLGDLLGVTDVVGQLTSLIVPTVTTTVGSMTGSALELTPNLIPDLRQLLGVDVLATATVTADELLTLLGSLLGGC